MELQASRLRARIDAQGTPIPLQQQNRGLWDRTLIEHGKGALRKAEATQSPLGVYTLQAAIARCHADANTPEQTDWQRIVALYDALVELTGSPVVELNRAVAVGMAFGPNAALELIDELAAEGILGNYYLLPATRGEFLEQLGRHAEAKLAFEEASGLAQNSRERGFLRGRAEKLGPMAPPAANKVRPQRG